MGNLGIPRAWTVTLRLATAALPIRVQSADIIMGTGASAFSLHGELFTVIARRDSGSGDLDDLLGKRVIIGNPGSSGRVIMDMVMAAKGWTRDSFRFVEELNGVRRGEIRVRQSG